MAGVDFDTVRREITSAARRAFDTIRASHPGEVFYTFALFSDDSAMTVCPAAMTEQAYDRCVAKEQECESRTNALAALGVHLDDYCASYLRWGLAEGVYEEGWEHFRAVYEMINADDRYDDRDPNGFVTFKGRVFASMALGLRDLDAEGYFGAGPPRDRVTLLCSASDSPCTAWLQWESALWLNPSAVFEVFSDQWCRDGTWLVAADANRRDPGHVYLAFADHLSTAIGVAEPGITADRDLYSE